MPSENDQDEAEAVNVLRTQIEQAFAGTDYPGDDKLIDESGVDIDADNAFDLLHGKTWEQLSSLLAPMVHGEIYCYGDAMHWITPQAYAYYLPALLIRTIITDVQTEMMQDSILYDLFGTTDWSKERVQQIAQALTKSQRQAVLDYIKFLRKRVIDFEDNYTGIVESWELLQEV